MRGFAKGLIAGGIIGIAGVTYALSDKRTRSRMVKDGKKAVRKANGVVDHISDMF